MPRYPNVWIVLPLTALIACNSPSTPAGDGGSDATNPGSDASSTSDAGLVFQVSAGPTSGTITGQVVDIATHAPIAGAAITAGTSRATSAADGSFSLRAPAGRVTVSVAASGYFAWSGQTSAGGEPRDLRVGVVALGPSQSVDASGAMINADGASLDVPAGAFAAPVTIHTAWVSGTNIYGLGVRTHLLDPTHSYSLVMLGQFTADVATEPTMPVTLHVPVPVGTLETEVFVAARGANGLRGVPIAATSVTGTTATFALPHLSVWDVLARAVLPHPAQTFTVVGTYSNGNAGPNGTGYSVDDQFEPGTQVTLPPGAAITVQDERGNQFTFRGQSPNWSDATDETVTVGSSGGMLLHALYDHYIRGSVTADYAVQWAAPMTDAEAADPPAQTDESASAAVQEPGLAVTADGTVFTVSGTPCPAADGTRTIDSIETDDGMVTAVVQGSSMAIAAGQQATACEGCAHRSDPPVCCDANNCANGCCDNGPSGTTVDGICQPGDTAVACGANGATCQNCGTGTCTAGMCPRCSIDRDCAPGYGCSPTTNRCVECSGGGACRVNDGATCDGQHPYDDSNPASRCVAGDCVCHSHWLADGTCTPDPMGCFLP